MRFLRTASTRHLLAMIAAIVGVIAAGTALAVAATGSGPVPRAQPLAKSIHRALTAKPVAGISADITFTNSLISSTDFTGGGTRDPLLQGASGRLWWSPGTGARLELQTSNGDGELVLTKKSFWFSDPASQTVYEGTIPADSSSTTSHKSAKATHADSVPSVASIQAQITKLMGHVRLKGARTSDPTDVGGAPAYSVSISPKHSAGLLGSAQLAWDAATGTPLKIAINAKGATSNPVLELKASNISFGAISASDINIPQPSGYKVVKIATPASHPAVRGAKTKGAHKQVSGLAAVAAKVPFKLSAPRRLVGLPRHTTTLLDWGGSPAALVTYGQNLGGLAVIEQKADSASAKPQSSGPAGNLSLPTVSIKGATGTELGTALGTVLRYTKGGVSYTLIGSVLPSAAEQAARALTP